MAEPPEFWVFTLSNLIAFGIGSFLTALSYVAYRSARPETSFRNAALGFGAITAGGAVEPVYQLGIKSDYRLGGRELLAMQAVEGILIAIGLGMLFYSISGYDVGSRLSGSLSGTDTDEST